MWGRRMTLVGVSRSMRRAHLAAIRLLAGPCGWCGLRSSRPARKPRRRRRRSRSGAAERKRRCLQEMFKRYERPRARTGAPINSGRVVGVFPEGTVRMQRCKEGLVRNPFALSRRPGRPAVSKGGRRDHAYLARKPSHSSPHWRMAALIVPILNSVAPQSGNTVAC